LLEFTNKEINRIGLETSIRDGRGLGGRVLEEKGHPAREMMGSIDNINHG
jgi:hypothetical protein